MRAVIGFFPTLFATLLACTACAATPTQPQGTTSVTLQGHSFSVQVATTPAEQAHGLMDRTSMPVDQGMLFVFPAAAPLTFWMKDTLIPLDILYFDDAHRLVAIQADAQPCKTDPCALYPSNVPARYVLELNAGTAAKIGARIGDAITVADAPSRSQ